jgi:hypothetical protein
MSPDETNRRVAEALGYEIVPAGEADSYYVVGVAHLFAAEDAKNRTRYFRGIPVDYRGYVDEFNPAEDVRDAIAALEAWTTERYTLNRQFLVFDAWIRPYFRCRIEAQKLKHKTVVAFGPTLPEAICAAILAAKEERDG